MVRLLKAYAKVSVPILPMYILKVKMAFPMIEKSEIQPVDIPQVVKAEVDSNKMFLKGTSGSKMANTTMEIKISTNDMTTIE